MKTEQLAYWATFAIPLSLLVVGCTTEKLIEGKPWNRRHFFVGIDLTTYFLAACLVNIADLTKEKVQSSDGYLWTVVMITVGIVMLFAQTAFHQEWEREEKSALGQIIMLCIASNVVGLLLLYAFVRLKVGRFL